MWQQYCFDDASETPMELYWIVTKCYCNEADTVLIENDYIIELKSHCADRKIFAFCIGFITSRKLQNATFETIALSTIYTC